MKVCIQKEDGCIGFVDVEEIVPLPSVPAVFPKWENVTDEFMWGFKNEGLAKWPDLGNGIWEPIALFLGNTVILDVYAEIGSTTKWPSGLEDRAWWFRPLSKRLTPSKAAVGPLKIYFKGKGALTGGDVCWEYNAIAEPPYWYLILRHSTMNATGAALTANFPKFSNTSCWSLDGSNWHFQIIYESLGG